MGIVVDDVESKLEQLSALFGYEWCDQMAAVIPVRVPGGEIEVDFRFRYSRTSPRLEIIRTAPGSLWVPAAGSGIHHLGYWSDNVPADSAALERAGCAFEAAGTRPDGTPYWAFHNSGSGPRIEIVSRSLQPAMEQYWAGG